MRDKFEREISYLRVSVTERCNLHCAYCRGNVEEDGCNAKTEELSVEEILEMVQAAVACGISKVRITGGEPLLRKDVVEICKSIHEVPGVEEVTLTTNGILLKQYAEALKKAGVSRLNISLDTLDAKNYREITGNGDIEAVLRGIEEAKRVGLLPIKINVVLLKKLNEEEIVSFVNLTKAEPIEVRFIELMPIGAGKEESEEQFLSGQIVLEKNPQLQPVEESGVAKLYQLPDAKGKVGLIRPVSRHFCPTCNRIRLTSDGKIKPCLHSAEEIDIRRLHGVELKQKIEEAILKKPLQHEDFANGKVSSAQRNMNQIGG